MVLISLIFVLIILYYSLYLGLYLLADQVNGEVNGLEDSDQATSPNEESTDDNSDVEPGLSDDGLSDDEDQLAREAATRAAAEAYYAAQAAAEAAAAAAMAAEETERARIACEEFSEATANLPSGTTWVWPYPNSVPSGWSNNSPVRPDPALITIIKD